MYKKDISIAKIEGHPTPTNKAQENVTPLTQRVKALRTKPLANFTIEDIRLSISQQLALSITLPLALEALNKNILAEGDLYEGDLLNSVIGLPIEYWVKHADEKKTLANILNTQATLLESSGLSNSTKEKIALFKSTI